MTRIQTVKRVTRTSNVVTYTLRAYAINVEASAPVHNAVHDGWRAFNRTLVWRQLERRIANQLRVACAARAACKAVDA